MGIVGKLTAEVAIACGASTRHHGDVLGEGRNGKLALQVEHALCLELLYYFLAAAHKVAHGILGVDVGHYPRESVGGMKLRLDTQHNLHSGMQALSGDALKHRTQYGPA